MIPGAKYRELPGTDAYPFHSNDHYVVLDEMEEFLTGERKNPPPDRILATIMFTDIVGSTQTAARLGDQRWRDLLASHNALTLAWVNEIGQGCDYELQRLHGLGDSLYQALGDCFEGRQGVNLYQ